MNADSHVMGQAQLRRQKFFADNPYCIFCGGQTRATTEDHYPPRSFFRNRQWPEGYVFPACELCNSVTSKDEQLLAMLARTSLNELSEKDNNEFLKAVHGVRNNHPGAINSMYMRAIEKRKALSALNIEKPDGIAYADFPMVRYPNGSAEAAKRFMFKLGCALHYKHTGRCLPPEGRVLHLFETNLMIAGRKTEQVLLDMTKAFPVVKRCNTSLDDQFNYRYGVSDELGAGVFYCRFRTSMLITLMTLRDPSTVEAENHPFGITVAGYLKGASNAGMGNL